MKVKALIDCVGLGYALKKGDEVDIKKELAEKLIAFNYVEKCEEVKQEGKKRKPKEKSDD
ncbi:hypothetical protein LRS37_04620 [Neobacillus sedimentimangrovi]|jgi:hypothetical protein|uniref:Uncharacterized protein n=1 Tax=Neobacillus sedimentimangrovi TaxID=2699460 RepID=A0ABS8QH90_9BACI|nr:hypothetical protein [Neobacillus sedimentimangrovi]MCD4838165.1 hypothetical protein [Neobacillus sedimentimangrovi]